MYSFLFFVYLPANRNNSLLSFIQKKSITDYKELYYRIEKYFMAIFRNFL